MNACFASAQLNGLQHDVQPDTSDSSPENYIFSDDPLSTITSPFSAENDGVRIVFVFHLYVFIILVVRTLFFGHPHSAPPSSAMNGGGMLPPFSVPLGQVPMSAMYDSNEAINAMLASVMDGSNMRM